MKNFYQSLIDSIFASRKYLLNHVPYKIIFLITGLLATIWFLLRVIPKPSRAGYPCMQAAAPLMSGFALYLLSFTGSFFAFRKATAMAKKRNYAMVTVFVATGLLMGALFFTFSGEPKDARASITIITSPPDGANNPMGVERGIMPGRVVWAWNPDATNSATTNQPGNAFWHAKNNDTLLIRGMVNESVKQLTGTDNLASAWDSIFYNHNRKKHNESRGYKNTETIFIKINQGTAQWVLTPAEKSNGYAWPESGAVNPSWRRNHFAASETGPFVVLNLLRQLVNVAGVPQENIAIGDPMSNTFKHNYAVWHNEFPNVKYTDKFSHDHNRTLIAPASNASMEYSDDGTVMTAAVAETYFTIMEQADYMINVACLKPHLRAGVTLCAKNHFGSISRSGAPHLHPSLIYPEEVGKPGPVNQGYNKYRVAVDIMGHKYLDGNTMLFVIEALFGGGPSETGPPVKWNSPPFNGDWTNSVFMSLDQVALESVGYDFLRSEFNGVFQTENWPNWLGVDDYLHQAADPANWPEGIVYNPDGRGPLKSLGVHEHWNNSIDKQYSRNLGLDYGIELIKIGQSAVSTTNENFQRVNFDAFPNPFTDQLNFSFRLENQGTLDIRLFDLQGRQVAGIERNTYGPGEHQISWSASNSGLRTGIYLLRMNISDNNFNKTQTIKIQFAN